MKYNDTHKPLGTDLQIQWHLYSSGKDVDIYGKNLQLTIIDPTGRRKKYPYTSNGSTMLAVFYGKNQQKEGWYDLELKLNPSQTGQVMISLHHAFYLTKGDCNYCQLDMSILKLTHDIDSGGEVTPDIPTPNPPVYTEKCYYGYMDGAEQDDMDDDEFMQVLQREAAAITLNGFQNLDEGDAFPGNTITFDYPKEYLWVLTPVTQPDFVTATEVSQGFVFPFEQIVTVTIGQMQYHARRSNGFNVGEKVTVRFA